MRLLKFLWKRWNFVFNCCWDSSSRENRHLCLSGFNLLFLEYQISWNSPFERWNKPVRINYARLFNQCFVNWVGFFSFGLITILFLCGISTLFWIISDPFQFSCQIGILYPSDNLSFSGIFRSEYIGLPITSFKLTLSYS